MGIKVEAEKVHDMEVDGGESEKRLEGFHRKDNAIMILILIL